MIEKGIKYIKALLRITILKLRFKSKFKFKFTGIKSLYIGKGVRIIIKNGNVLSFGNNVYIDDCCSFECVKGSIYVGDNTFFNTNNKIVSLKRVTVGENCLFGPNVGIFDHDHNFKSNDLPIVLQGYSTKEINIGNDIWIGCNCTITSGVTISDKVVVAANSVVTKDLNSNSVYGGVPCKFIKYI